LVFLAMRRSGESRRSDYARPVLLRGWLLFPLHGVFLILGLAMLALHLFALIDAVSHPDAAYVATGKQSKTFWLLVLIISLFFTLLGLIATLVYLIDVRPVLHNARGRGGGRGGGTSSSDGPYGPYRG
jgi:uncharacterized membrane protein